MSHGRQRCPCSSCTRCERPNEAERPNDACHGATDASRPTTDPIRQVSPLSVRRRRTRRILRSRGRRCRARRRSGCARTTRGRRPWPRIVALPSSTQRWWWLKRWCGLRDGDQAGRPGHRPQRSRPPEDLALHTFDRPDGDDRQAGNDVGAEDLWPRSHVHGSTVRHRRRPLGPNGLDRPSSAADGREGERSRHRHAGGHRRPAPRGMPDGEQAVVHTAERRRHTAGGQHRGVPAHARGGPVRPPRPPRVRRCRWS